MSDDGQPSLFNLPPALDAVRSTEARDEAIARVDANAHELWEVWARTVVVEIAERLETFTSDDFVATGYPSAREPRALGAIFQQLSREGVIVPTGEYRLTRQVSRHRAPVRVWRKG